MAAKVYVGNLSWNTTDDGLAHAFSAYGQLTDYVSLTIPVFSHTFNITPQHSSLTCVALAHRTDRHEGP